MKNKLSLLITILPMSLILYTCSKDDQAESITQEVQYVTDSYEEDVVKIENYDDGTPKIEIHADPELTAQIHRELDASHSKQITYLKSTGREVGVFKWTTCGSYKELLVFMDCEDHLNRSSITGQHGTSSVNSSGNAYLRFCVLDNEDLFKRYSSDYAILKLNNSDVIQNGYSIIRNWVINEKTKNCNYTNYDGTDITHNNSDHWFGDCNFSHNKTILTWYYYQKSSSPSAFPDLGISYGVLGTFGSSTGSIYTDDEDDGWEHSALDLKIWNGSGWIWTTPTEQLIPGVMEVSNNTRIYLSKAL